MPCADAEQPQAEGAEPAQQPQQQERVSELMRTPGKG
eukprot:gene14338-8284_t